MFKLIDLDAPTKDHDGHLFTLTVNGEKCGFTEAEVTELLRSKHNTGKNSRKGASRGKTPTAADASQEANMDEVASESEAASANSGSEFIESV